MKMKSAVVAAFALGASALVANGEARTLTCTTDPTSRSGPVSFSVSAGDACVLGILHGVTDAGDDYASWTHFDKMVEVPASADAISVSCSLPGGWGEGEYAHHRFVLATYKDGHPYERGYTSVSYTHNSKGKFVSDCLITPSNWSDIVFRTHMSSTSGDWINDGTYVNGNYFFVGHHGGKNKVYYGTGRAQVIGDVTSGWHKQKVPVYMDVDCGAGRYVVSNLTGTVYQNITATTVSPTVEAPITFSQLHNGDFYAGYVWERGVLVGDFHPVMCNGKAVVMNYVTDVQISSEVAVTLNTATNFNLTVSSSADFDFIPSPYRWYVTPDGSGDGSSWDAPCGLESALKGVVAGGEIWIKQGDYVLTENANSGVSTGDIMILGGFRGNEENASDRVRGNPELTTISGDGQFEIIRINSAASATIEDLKLMRSPTYALVKQGSGDLTIRNCRFYGNSGTTWYDGRAISAVGGAGATLRIENCTIDNNLYTATGCNVNRTAGAVYLSTWNRVFVDDTNFATNGWPFNASSGGPLGAALYATAAPVTCRRSHFFCNASGKHTGQGGIVYLDGASGGSAFTNCTFVGNAVQHSDAMNKNNATASGCFVVNLSTVAATVDFKNCTIAYNLLEHYQTAAGLQITKGTVSMKDSIVFANANKKSGDSHAPADVMASANGRFNASYSMFTAEGADYITSDPDKVTLSECMFGDPKFVTSAAEYLASFYPGQTGTNKSGYPYSSSLSYAYFYDMVYAHPFDVHLRSAAGRWNGSAFVTDGENSDALDRGDPASSYEFEPNDPAGANGGCVNLGAYGNTPEASKSSALSPEIGEITVDAQSDYTQPHLHVTAGGSGSYEADICLCWGDSDGGAGIDGWQHSVVGASGVKLGDVVDVRTKEYLPANATVQMKVVMLVGGEVVNESEVLSVTVGNELPPWLDRGGPANVIHVRAGATGLENGRNWTDAVRTIAEALALLDGSHDEIWVAVGYEAAAHAAPATVPVSCVIRGGFAASGRFEDTAEARVSDAVTAVDYGRTADSLALVTTGGIMLTFERFVFRNPKDLSVALAISGEGSVVLRECGFLLSSGDHIRALDASGAGTATLVMTNCTVGGFVETSSVNETYQKSVGVNVSGFGRAYIDDSTFASNGVPRTSSNKVGIYRFASALRSTSPVTVRNCRFIDNVHHCHVNPHGTVSLVGPAEICAFTNCLFAGNCGIRSDVYTYKNGGNEAGVVHAEMANETVAVDFVNCTFAYNLQLDTAAPVALNVFKAAAKVRNSIFWCNVSCGDGEKRPSDIDIMSGSCDVDYSMFADTGAEYVSANCRLGAKVLTGNPYFMSTTNDFKQVARNNLSAFSMTSTARSAVHDPRFDSALDDSPFNLHLRGKAGYVDEKSGVKVTDGGMPPESGLRQSPAIDAGMRTGALCEPQPNGGRFNLGFYGNTPWATCSVTSGFYLFLK